jgi:hypothetical protein
VVALLGRGAIGQPPVAQLKRPLGKHEKLDHQFDVALRKALQIRQFVVQILG